MDGNWYTKEEYLFKFGKITKEHIGDDTVICPCQRKTSIAIKDLNGGKAVISSSQVSIMEQLLIDNINFNPDDQGILVYSDKVYGDKIVEIRGILSKDSIRISKQPR